MTKKPYDRYTALWKVCNVHWQAWSHSEPCRAAIAGLRDRTAAMEPLLPKLNPLARQNAWRRGDIIKQLASRVLRAMNPLRQMAADHPEMGIRTAHLPNRHHRSWTHRSDSAVAVHAEEVFALVSQRMLDLHAYGYPPLELDEFAKQLEDYRAEQGTMNTARSEYQLLLDGCAALVHDHLDPAIADLDGVAAFKEAYRRSREALDRQREADRPEFD